MALDEVVLEACYPRLKRPRCNVPYRCLWNTSECQDATPEAFLEVWARCAKVEVAGLDALTGVAAGIRRPLAAGSRIDNRARTRHGDFAQALRAGVDGHFVLGREPAPR
jgi:hypothetical protein